MFPYYTVPVEHGFELRSPFSSYVLEMDSKSGFSRFRVGCTPFDSFFPEHLSPRYFITDRDLKYNDRRGGYDEKIPGIHDLPLCQAQYIEIGAGLGELTPYLVEHLPAGSPKPVVIDPANYGCMRRMLRAVKPLVESGNVQRIDENIRRIDTITDPSKVRLYNMSLRAAIMLHPHLAGSADFVVDNMGAIFYETPWEQRHESPVVKLERRLLKKDGTLLAGSLSQSYSVTNGQ